MEYFEISWKTLYLFIYSFIYLFIYLYIYIFIYLYINLPTIFVFIYFIYPHLYPHFHSNSLFFYLPILNLIDKAVLYLKTYLRDAKQVENKTPLAFLYELHAKSGLERKALRFTYSRLNSLLRTLEVRTCRIMSIFIFSNQWFLHSVK